MVFYPIGDPLEGDQFFTKSLRDQTSLISDTLSSSGRTVLGDSLQVPFCRLMKPGHI